MKKKFLAMLLTGVMAATLLAGCGSKTDTVGTDTETKTEDVKEAETNQ